MINTLLTIDLNKILIGILAGVVLVLFVMLVIERGKRKKAQARASKLSAEARRAPQYEPDDGYDNGAIHTIRESVADDAEPSLKLKTDNRTPISNPVGEAQVNHPAVPKKPIKAAPSAQMPEEINNGKVYSDDKLLIDELDADESDFLILPKGQKQEKKKTKKNKKHLLDDKVMQNLVIEESYEPLISEEKPSAKPQPKPDENKAAAPVIEKAPVKAEAVPTEPKKEQKENSPIPESTEPRSEAAPQKPQPEEKAQQTSPYTPISDKLMGISAAFASIADRVKPKEQPTRAAAQPEKNSAPPEKKEKAPIVLNSLSDKAKQYADRGDMFEKAPYKLPNINPQHNPAAFASSVTVPASLTVKMKEPVYENGEQPVMAEREGEVSLNIFMKSEKDEKSGSKNSLYEVVDTVKPTFEAEDVITLTTDTERYTVEEAKREPISEAEKKTAVAGADDYKAHQGATGFEELLIVEETPRALSGDDDEASYLINGEVVQVRYRSSFMSRLIQAPTDVQDIYAALKNEILSYEGLKVKNSWNYESFNRDGEQCVKLNVRGRSVMVYLALDPVDYLGTKYRFKDMSSTPRFEKVPMLLSVRTERGVKYATELIAELMAKIGAARGETQKVDYRMPYEDNAALALRGLVKLILPDGVSVNNNSEIVSVDVDEFINGSSRSADN